ncbi:MAG: cupin domain-containing protein [Proteobacteria bacterium]|nr:cupin domain-containing protein [Pseudomonadota bacterium]
MRAFRKFSAVARIAGFAWALSAASVAQAGDAIVTALRTTPVAEMPGWTLETVLVEYPPGGSSKPHQHDAYVLVYVLDGAIETQVSGGPLVTLHAGETFEEKPADVHQVSRNASSTAPAKFLAVLLKRPAKP